jgi:hypothetical protein
MSIWSSLLEAAIPLILSAAQSIADSAVDGASLNKDQKQALYGAYVLINLYGDDIVESTENIYDNASLDALSSFASDTLAEAGIMVPIIPAELEYPSKPEPEG